MKTWHILRPVISTLRPHPWFICTMGLQTLMALVPILLFLLVSSSFFCQVNFRSLVTSANPVLMDITPKGATRSLRAIHASETAYQVNKYASILPWITWCMHVRSSAETRLSCLAFGSFRVSSERSSELHQNNPLEMRVWVWFQMHRRGSQRELQAVWKK